MNDPKLWGPKAWSLFNYIVLSYSDLPNELEKTNMKNFFTSVGHVLPCNLCKQHYSETLIKYPIDDTVLASKSSLVKWLINIHNEVNISNGKAVLTHEEGLKQMLEQCEGTTPLSYYFTIIIVILFVIFIIYGIYLLYNKYYAQ
jgi:hypothetical protein